MSLVLLSAFTFAATISAGDRLITTGATRRLSRGVAAALPWRTSRPRHARAYQRARRQEDGTGGWVTMTV